MRSALLLCCLAEAPADQRRLAAFNYMEVAKLTANDAAAGDRFGWSVAIDGDTVVVGAWSAGTGGAAYVFRTSDGGATYGQVAKLTADDAAAGDDFGWSVAIDGDTVVVGSRDKEAAYVFRTTDGGATYSQVAKLIAADAAAGDRFGYSVAIDGDTIVIGAYYDDDGGWNSGSAYVFRTTDGGATYSQLAKLTAADAAAGDRFGYSVAIDGDTVVVGAYNDGNTGYCNSCPGSGAAYVFHTTDGGATYGQVAKLSASDAAASDGCGISVAIDGDTIVVGAYAPTWDGGSGWGSAYIFRTSDGGATYVEVAKLTAADAALHDSFGYSVAITGVTVVVGADGDDPGGAVYVFRTSDGGATYAQVAKLTADDAAEGDSFGRSVSIDGGTVVVGALGDDDDGSYSGSAYVFDANAPTSQPTTGHPTPRPSPRPTPSPTTQPTARPSPRPTPQPTSQPTTVRPTAQPTKQVDVVDSTPWMTLLSIAGFIFCVGGFVCIDRMCKSRPSAKTSPTAPEVVTPPMLRTTSVLPMGTVEAVQAPDAAAAPPILGEVVTHSTVLSVSN